MITRLLALLTFLSVLSPISANAIVMAKMPNLYACVDFKANQILPTQLSEKVLINLLAGINKKYYEFETIYLLSFSLAEANPKLNISQSLTIKRQKYLLDKINSFVLRASPPIEVNSFDVFPQSMPYDLEIPPKYENCEFLIHAVGRHIDSFSSVCANSDYCSVY